MFLTAQFFAANITQMFVLPIVTFYVISIRSLVQKQLGANFTFKSTNFFRLNMGEFFVSSQVPCIRKCFTTQIALIRFVSFVEVKMFQEPGFDEETFVTNCTLIRVLLIKSFAVSFHVGCIGSRVFAILTLQMSFHFLMPFFVRMKFLLGFESLSIIRMSDHVTLKHFCILNTFMQVSHFTCSK